MDRLIVAGGRTTAPRASRDQSGGSRSRNAKAYPALVMDQVMTLLGAHDSPINFCQAGSSFNPFDHVDVGLSRGELREHTPYAHLNGSPRLRRSIVDHYGERFGCDVDPSRVCITAGATEALLIAFAMLTKPGGEVILAESHFPPFRCLAHMFGVKCRFAPVNERHTIDVHKLGRLINRKTQAIVVNAPSNPHGALLGDEELSAISRLGVPVIFDEVYQSLGLWDTHIPTAVKFAEEHIVVNSFSKSLSLAGFRVGYMIVPESLVPLMTDVKATTAFSTSSAGQAICEAMLEHWDPLIAKHRAMLREQWAYFAQCAAACGLKLYPAPEAGLYGLLDVSRSARGSASLALDLARDEGVGVAPGSDFQPSDPRFLRLNYAAPTSHIAPGLARIASCLERG